jgi:hypothetical protein
MVVEMGKNEGRNQSRNQSRNQGQEEIVPNEEE